MLIFMEYCEEGTLESLVAAYPDGLPEQVVRNFTRQLLLAVSTLHQHGIVHRDIKSEFTICTILTALRVMPSNFNTYRCKNFILLFWHA
jgi:serine/threonine protein kinase